MPVEKAQHASVVSIQSRVVWTRLFARTRNGATLRVSNPAMCAALNTSPFLASRGTHRPPPGSTPACYRPSVLLRLSLEIRPNRHTFATIDLAGHQTLPRPRKFGA